MFLVWSTKRSETYCRLTHLASCFLISRAPSRRPSASPEGNMETVSVRHFRRGHHLWREPVLRGAGGE